MLLVVLPCLVHLRLQSAVKGQTIAAIPGRQIGFDMRGVPWARGRSVAAPCVAFFSAPFHSVDSPTTAACGIESTRMDQKAAAVRGWPRSARCLVAAFVARKNVAPLSCLALTCTSLLHRAGQDPERCLGRNGFVP